MRVNMISLSPKRASVRTILWLVFSIALLSNMARIPFTTSIAYASSMDTPQLLSDINDDGVVDIYDVIEVGKAYGTYPGHPDWNARADLNDDGFVDILDLVRVATDRIADADTAVGRLWSADSYWYMKIKANPTLHPNNDEMIAWLVGEGSNYQGGNVYINWRHYTSPVWDAYEDSPRFTVYDEDGNAGTHWWYNVPWPSGAVAVTDDQDKTVGIIDWVNRDLYSFWNFRHYGGYIEGQYAEWIAGAGWKWDLDGSGVAPLGQWTVGGSSTPGSGALLIRPEEIEAGVISHPLGCCLKTPKKGVQVYPPASTTDGKSTTTYAIPEGARIQLDPSVNLDSLGLNPTAKIIAKAMQDYGIVVKESGGGWFLYAEHDLSANWDSNMGNGILANLPNDKWRVIDYTQGATANLELP